MRLEVRSRPTESRPDSWRRHLLPVLAWTILCVLFFGTILAGHERLPSGDFYAQFHAFGLFQAREMAQGRLPVWSPGSYAGTPFAADTQAAVFYPLRWLTILLSLPWGFPPLALEMEAILHIWLAGVFTYALAYAITREPLAALTGAVAFSLGGYLTSYPLLQLAILETIAWLPLALLLLRLGVDRERPLPWLLAAGLVLALSALAGHPQTFLHVSYFAAAYYLFLTIRARWSWRWIVALGALIAAVAIGGSSAALLPALRYVRHTVRSDVSYGFVATGLPLLNYAQLLVPGALSFWSVEYLGIAGIVLAMWAIWGRQARRQEITFWSVAALLAGWLALGDKGVAFELVYRLLPGFALFQRQERLLGVYSLSLALLAAQGLALWLNATAGSLRAPLRRVALAAAAGLLLLAPVLLVTADKPAQDWLGVWGRQWLVLAAVLALLWGNRQRRLRAWGLVLLLGADLYVSTLGAIDRQPGPLGEFWRSPEWVQVLRSEEPSRIDSGRLIFGNLGEIYGLEDVRGASPLKLRPLDELGQLPRERRWQLLNVTHVLATTPPAGVPLTKVADIEDGPYPDRPLHAAVYRFDAALPRAWLSYAPLLAPDDAAALQLVADPAFDPATSVVLTGLQDAADIAAPAPGHEPEVRVSRLGPGALDITLSTEQPGFLVVSEWYYPGWQAQLDGRRVPILKANYAFQAVRVPAGTHQVVVRYVPWLEGLGILVSAFAIALAALLAWRWRPAIALRRPSLACPPAAARKRPSAAGGIRPWLCVAVILLGFGLRAYRLGFQELRGDEAFSYLQVQHPLAEIAPHLLQEGDPHPPLHYWLLRGWMQLAGDGEFAMRFPSLGLSLLLLPLLYQLGRRLGSVRLGVLAATLAAISQSQVWIGQDVRSQYTLVMFFSTLATVLLARAVERPAWHRWAFYAGACALTVYSHYYGVFVLVAHALCLLIVPGWRRRLWAWAASASAAALAFAPWAVLSWPRMAGAGQLSQPSRPELAAHLTAVGGELAVGRALGPPLDRWLFLAALGLCILGARELFRRARGWAVLLVTWLVGAALGIFLLRFSRATFNTFYILVASVAWWVLVAVGVQWLWQRRGPRPRALAAVAVAGLVAANGVALGRYYLEPAYSRSGGYRGIAGQISAQAEAGDLFLRNFPDPCYDYYLRGVPITRAMQPATAGAPREETERSLAELAARYDRLWFVPAAGSQWDREGVVANWLEYNALLEQETVHQTRTLRAYRPLHSIGQVMAPLDESIDGLLRLEGVHVTVNGRPVDLDAPEIAVPPGAALKVTLLWEPLVEPREDYSVFVHLLGEDNRLVAQHDGLPAFGTRMGWTWRPGEQMLDRHDLSVPAELSLSTASLVVGVYDSETVTRRPFASGGDALLLAQVRFEGH